MSWKILADRVQRKERKILRINDSLADELHKLAELKAKLQDECPHLESVSVHRHGPAQLEGEVCKVCDTFSRVI